MSNIKRAYFKDGVEKGARKLEYQVATWITDARVNGAVIGLSGGIDSTVTGCIYNEAINKLGKYNFSLFGLIMPSNTNSNFDNDLGIQVAEDLGIGNRVIPIQKYADMFIQDFPELFDDEFHIGNLYSELRAVILSRFAGKNKCLIAGTGNWLEDEVLGYFTKRGDGAVDNNVLGNLPKRLVYELGRHYEVNESILNREPTAGLEDGQTDKNDLGYSYDTAERVFRGYVQGMSFEGVALESKVPFEIVEAVIKRHRANRHKTEPLPNGEVELVYR